MAKSENKTERIYCDGVFDLFHYGHAKVFEQVKKMRPGCKLVVGLCADKDIVQYKGQPVMTGEERKEALRHCQWIDEVVYPCPWKPTVKFLKEHNIDYIAHDDIPYKTGDEPDVYKEVKDAGMFLATKRTEGISTSDLISRIVKDREEYIWRNLSKGINRKEMNVSLPYEQWIRFKHTQLPKIKSFFTKSK